MRTTVTLDDDVRALLKRAMKDRDASFKQVLNDGLRIGLSTPRERVALVQPTFAMGLPLADLTKASTLAGELDDQAMVEKLRGGR